jgi:hypothetical protein
LNAEHIDRRFSGRLPGCYPRAGRYAGQEKQLDYLVAYAATSGHVTGVKGAMFGRQPNAELLGCVNEELTGAETGKVRKDPEGPRARDDRPSRMTRA